MTELRTFPEIHVTERSYDPHEHISRIGLAPAPHVVFQVGNYIKAQRLVHNLRPQGVQRSDIDRVLAALEFTLLGFYASRDERPSQLASEKIIEATELKESLIEGHPFFCNCSDGRCYTKMMWGYHGQTLRFPGGESKEFKWDSKQQQIYLPDDSMLALELKKTITELKRRLQRELIEVFDSHWHCLARKTEEEDRWCMALADYGLYYDFVKKIEIIKALERFLTKHYGGEITLSPIHTTFIPETGGSYLGLERHLGEEWIRSEGGFTEGVIQRLLADGGILSSVELLTQSEIRKAFAQNEFELDYEYDYVDSSWNFWQGMSRMMDSAHAHILGRVNRIYHDASSVNNRRRALLLLANAYTRYLLSLKYGDVYPYSEHTESIISKSVTEKGPFCVAHAASLDPTIPNPSTPLKFFADLIRANRRKGNMSDPEKDMVAQVFGSYDACVSAPVPMVGFRRVPHNDLPALQALRETDWSDLVYEPWQQWNSGDVERYLLRKISGRIHYISSYTLHAVTELCEKAKEIYRYGLPSTESLVEGRIVNAPTFTGPQRETIAIFPFISAEAV